MLSAFHHHTTYNEDLSNFKMKKFVYTLFLVFIMSYTSGIVAQGDTIISYKKFSSEFIDDRNVDVWLPPSYDKDSNYKFPVVYMHDGQNLFMDSLSYTQISWGVDDWIRKLTSENNIPEVIVVGIWNTPKRYSEYQPQKPFYLLKEEFQTELADLYGGKPESDNYLKFIVKELKPFIDKNYNTDQEQQSTYIMGSSMGGLISLYALCEYPEVFGAAGCLSTHWVTRVNLESSDMQEAMVKYLTWALPSPANHKIYFDFGTIGLDYYYGSHQAIIDSIMIKQGYINGQNWITKKIEGADHNEKSWRERLSIPLQFLLDNR